MVTDSRREVRREAIKLVLSSRELTRTSGTQDVRKFHVPALNFKARSYEGMANLQGEMVDPPLLRCFSEEALQAALDAPDGPPVLDIPTYPCHAQSVERLVQVVGRAAENACGFGSRDQLIRSQLTSREAMPKYRTKSDFKLPFIKEKS